MKGPRTMRHPILAVLAVIAMLIGLAAPAALADESSSTDPTTASAESTASAAPTVDSGEPTQEPEAPASSSEPAPATEPDEPEATTDTPADESAPAEESGDDPSDAPAQPDAAERQDDSATQAGGASNGESADSNTSQQKENSATEAESSANEESAVADVEITDLGGSFNATSCTVNFRLTYNGGPATLQVRRFVTPVGSPLVLTQASGTVTHSIPAGEPSDGDEAYFAFYEGTRLVSDTSVVVGVCTAPPANQPPTATITELTQDVRKVDLRGEVSDPNGTGDIERVWWEFGDGSDSVGGLTAQHTYAAPGTYEVKFSATDKAGVTRSDTRQVTVVNLTPVARIATPQVDPDVPNGLTVSFNGKGSSDPDGDALTYAWDLGFTTDSGPEPRVTFPSYGSKTVTLTVTDAFGATSSTEISFTLDVPPTSTEVVWGPDYCVATDGTTVDAYDSNFELRYTGPDSTHTFVQMTSVDGVGVSRTDVVVQNGVPYTNRARFDLDDGTVFSLTFFDEDGAVVDMRSFDTSICDEVVLVSAPKALIGDSSCLNGMGRVDLTLGLLPEANTSSALAARVGGVWYGEAVTVNVGDPDVTMAIVGLTDGPHLIEVLDENGNVVAERTVIVDCEVDVPPYVPTTDDFPGEYNDNINCFNQVVGAGGMYIGQGSGFLALEYQDIQGNWMVDGSYAVQEVSSDDSFELWGTPLMFGEQRQYQIVFYYGDDDPLLLASFDVKRPTKAECVEVPPTDEPEPAPNNPKPNGDGVNNNDKVHQPNTVVGPATRIPAEDNGPRAPRGDGAPDAGDSGSSNSPYKGAASLSLIAGLGLLIAATRRRKATAR